RTWQGFAQQCMAFVGTAVDNEHCFKTTIDLESEPTQGIQQLRYRASVPVYGNDDAQGLCQNRLHASITSPTSSSVSSGKHGSVSAVRACRSVTGNDRSAWWPAKQG